MLLANFSFQPEHFFILTHKKKKRKKKDTHFCASFISTKVTCISVCCGGLPRIRLHVFLLMEEDFSSCNQIALTYGTTCLSLIRTKSHPLGGSYVVWLSTADHILNQHALKIQPSNINYYYSMREILLPPLSWWVPKKLSLNVNKNKNKGPTPLVIQSFIIWCAGAQRTC